jgi:integrase
VRKYQLATLGASLLGDLRLTEFSTDAIERYKQQRRREVGARAVNNELKVLQAVFSLARELGVPVGTFTVKPLPVIGRGRVVCWNDDQLAHFWTACREEAPKMLGVCTFLANTGCREGEAIHAEWEWIDRKPTYVSVQPNAHWQPKSNEPREIPIADSLAPWLSVERKHPRWIFVHRKKRTYRAYAGWPKKQFARIVDIASRAMCRPGCPGRKKKAKCKRGCPSLTGGAHTLRHTYASHFLRGHPDMYLLAQILGHSHERVTELYAHLLPDHLERARNVVNMGAGVGPAAIEAKRRWSKPAR